MDRKNGFGYTCATVLLSLVLLAPVLAACGSDDQNGNPTTPCVPAAGDEETETFNAPVPTMEGPITQPGEPFQSGKTFPQIMAASPFGCKAIDSATMARSLLRF